MTNIFEIVINDVEIQSLIKDRQLSYYQKEIGGFNENFSNIDYEKVLRIEHLLLTNLFSESTTIQNKDQYFDTAYLILKSLDIDNKEFDQSFSHLMAIDEIKNYNLYYFYLASIALTLDNTIRIRMDLKEYIAPNYDRNNWKSNVFNRIIEAFVLIVRKQNGFEDIREAIEIINQLKSDQQQYEEEYLNTCDNETEKLKNAQFLLGLYHLSKTITETAEYLTQGYNYKGKIESTIRIHSDVARKLFVDHPRIVSFVNTLEINLNTLFKNSIWYSTGSIPVRKLKEFCQLKSELENSLVELLPSQRIALQDNLLDIASNVTVVEMPTSSGKTLLAEFNIIVTKALNPEAKVVYIVPSRALVNQVYFDLKSDFDGLDFAIEKTSGAIEVDPSENEILQEDIDVLVSTPEKLDLLIRRNHPSVENISLFIVDEAHMIKQGSRGAKLELLLSILKRERQEAKFMFLSPFLKDSASDIADWIGGDKIRHSIRVNWKPAEKLAIGIKQRNNYRQCKFTLLPSAYSSIKEEQELEPIDLKDPIQSTGKRWHLEFAAKHFSAPDKTILYLCRGAGTIDKHADFLTSKIQLKVNSEEVELVRKYILDEVGRETVLSKALQKGVAVHHAGLSDETKLLVEHLIRKKHVNHVFATSTLADGVNFPVSAVYFDTFEKGRKADRSVNTITPNDFWNISGRAGRTMVDNVGKILFPFNDNKNTQKAKDLINNSSEELLSVLLEFVIDADDIINLLENSERSAINTLSYRYPDSLAPLIQYLIHLINISKNDDYLEIEDLFKDSFGYHLLENNDRSSFINVCKSIYYHLKAKYKPGILVYADKTGFSVPSVLSIMRENSENPQIATPESWDTTNLFSFNNNYLADKISVIAQLKETGLGTDSTNKPFNPYAVAQVLKGWVKGESLFDVSGYHPAFSNNDNEADRINKFIKYINNARFKASWGLSALEGIINASDEDIQENSYIPSLVYFGVESKEALLMRMAGVPRRIAQPLSGILKKDELPTMTQVRKRINNLPNSEWDNLVPKGSNLSGQEWKLISEILVK
jgi:hypothetical protein